MPSKKSNFFENLEQGLGEAIAHAQGNPKSGTKTRAYQEAKRRSATQIRRLRSSLGKTQAEFASLLSVSQKTIEAWEAGTKHPTGPALRMFEILETHTVRLSSEGTIKLRSKAG
jgi:putative transcriptional regulator